MLLLFFKGNVNKDNRAIASLGTPQFVHYCVHRSGKSRFNAFDSFYYEIEVHKTVTTDPLNRKHRAARIKYIS